MSSTDMENMDLVKQKVKPTLRKKKLKKIWASFPVLDQNIHDFYCTCSFENLIKKITQQKKERLLYSKMPTCSFFLKNKKSNESGTVLPQLVNTYKIFFPNTAE